MAGREQSFDRITVSEAIEMAQGATITGGGLELGAADTPASVATTPGTANTSAQTVTGGVGGATSIATTGVGGVGSGATITLGAGGSATAAETAATGGAGGAYTLTTGAGGAEAIAGTASTGGAGGAYTVTTGAGGAVSLAVTTAIGGASGALSVLSGTGGAVTATGGTNTGGASGAVIVGSGVGGACSGATDTGGASGAVTIRTGTGGAGDTGGASGAITLQTGAAGAGGSPATGDIIFQKAALEKGRISGTATTATLALGVAATSTGSVLLAGLTSGVVTLSVGSVAGTWSMILPAAVGSAGQQLTDAGGNGICTWAAASLGAWKNDLGILDPHEALKAVVSAPTHKFTYNRNVLPPGQWDGAGAEMHGIFAEEAPWAMHGQRDGDSLRSGIAFSPVNAFGYARAAIEALHERLAKAEARLERKGA